MWGQKMKGIIAWVLVCVMMLPSVVYAGVWSGMGPDWYYVQDGTAQIGWIKDHDAWYKMGQDGRMCTGWLKEGNDWYFLNTVHDGFYGRAIAGQWAWIDGYCYAFDADGRMYANCTTPDGYEVDADGRWIQNGQVQFIDGKGILTKPEKAAGSGSENGMADSDSGGSSFSSSRVTREEWVAKLAKLLEMDGSHDGQYSYDDYEKAEKPALIEAAVRAGFVPIEADEDNMMYFRPKDYATREFLAYTAVHALSYQAAGTETSIDWADMDSIQYLEEARLAVELGILSLDGNMFKPAAGLTSEEVRQAEAAVKRILNSTVITSAEGTVEYADGVTAATLQYLLEEEDGRVTIENDALTAGWQPGEIHVLQSADGAEKDIAIKIVSIMKENGCTVIDYEEPALEDVIVSVNLEGIENKGGVLIPAEGVELTPVGRGRSSIAAYAADSGTIDLFQKYNLAVNLDDVSFKGTIDIKELEYRFSASTEWFQFSIDEIYLALNSALEGSFSYSRSLEKDIKKKIADFNIPAGWGFNASGEIYLIFSAEGGVELSFEINNKTGIQYTKAGGIRPVCRMDADINEFSLNGEMKGGFAVEPGAEFLGINLVSIGAELGLGFEGTMENISVVPFEFCLDGTNFHFLTIFAQIGPDDFNIRFEREILNSDNSAISNLHFEETGYVPECTRGNGSYDGYVKNADNGQPIYQAKVQILRDGRILDTTYTDRNGFFTGLKQKHGTYTLRVSAAGFMPYERIFDIVGGQTTGLETQLMVSRENQQDNQGQRFLCAGNITDAYTGMALEGVHVLIKSSYLNGNGETAAEVDTDGYGNYQCQVPVGNYEIITTKDGYVTNYRYITVAGEITNADISMNPENQSIDANNLRIVLRWGAEPNDLDSHLVGPGGHVFYMNMNMGEANLDVDDVTSFGPETISILDGGSNSYSYYVHDYTNREQSVSSALGNSGAYVQIYADNTLLYTVHVPAGRQGTLWHVFDYDFEAGRISLVNEFSYEEMPWNIGSSYALFGLDYSEYLKPYELEVKTATSSNAAAQRPDSGSAVTQTATSSNAALKTAAMTDAISISDSDERKEQDAKTETGGDVLPSRMLLMNVSKPDVAGEKDEDEPDQ